MAEANVNDWIEEIRKEEEAKLARRIAERMAETATPEMIQQILDSFTKGIAQLEGSEGVEQLKQEWQVLEGFVRLPSKRGTPMTMEEFSTLFDGGKELPEKQAKKLAEAKGWATSKVGKFLRNTEWFSSKEVKGAKGKPAKVYTLIRKPIKKK